MGQPIGCIEDRNQSIGPITPKKKKKKLDPVMLTSVEIIPSLMPTSPYSRASDTRQEREIFVVKMYAASPG